MLKKATEQILWLIFWLPINRNLTVADDHKLKRV